MESCLNRRIGARMNLNAEYYSGDSSVVEILAE